MKTLAILSTLFLLTPAVAQKSITIVDANSKLPVADVQVYNSTGSFAGISNDDGKFKALDSQFPLKMKHYAYETRTGIAFADTIYLQPAYQDLSEVQVKPVNKMDRYNEIIEHSSSLANTAPTGSDQTLFRNIGGVYYKSVLIVNQDTKDTVRIDATCDLQINVEKSKKSADYGFLCSNGSKIYYESKNYSGSLDTSVVARCMAFVPKFEKNLKYDLIDTKPYKLKFEEEKISLGLEGDYQLMTFEENGKRSEQYNVLFKELQMKLWEFKTYSNKEYDGGNIFVDIDFISNDVVFGGSEELYFFNELQNKTQIEMVAGGDKYLIMAVQGFIKTDINPEKRIESKPEDYLEEIEYSNSNAQLYNFDNFDERN